jgi:hypothetical protein
MVGLVETILYNVNTVNIRKPDCPVVSDLILYQYRIFDIRTIRKPEVMSGFRMASLDRLLKKRVIKIFDSWQNILG